MTLTDTEYIHRISNHPVHILDEHNIPSPSAFIPFCSFGGNMSVMQEYVPNFPNRVCNKFSPIVLEGRICYQVDVNEFMNQVDSKKLMTHGLIFMMDYNEDRLGLDTNNDETSVDKDYGDMQKKDDKKEKAMIYIETLGMHNYELNSL